MAFHQALLGLQWHGGAPHIPMLEVSVKVNQVTAADGFDSLAAQYRAHPQTLGCLIYSSWQEACQICTTALRVRGVLLRFRTGRESFIEDQHACVAPTVRPLAAML